MAVLHMFFSSRRSRNRILNIAGFPLGLLLLVLTGAGLGAAEEIRRQAGETLLPRPDAGRAAFRAADGDMERRSLVPELARTHLARGEFHELPALFDEVADSERPWLRFALEADLCVALGDRQAEYAARQEMWRHGADDIELLDRLWDLAIEVEDEEGILRFSRKLANVSEDRVHRMDHWRFLLRLDRDEEFVRDLEAHAETLFTIRSLFPELLGLGKLDLLDGLVRAAEEDADWPAWFALGEYWLFRGNADRSREYFRDLAGDRFPGDGGTGLVQGFPRLNQAFFDRYVVLRNRAFGLGTYGSDAHVAYAFFGMRELFEIETREQARDAAILYWKHDALDRGEPRTFRRNLTAELDVDSIPHGERVLALANAGFTEAMMDAVYRYLEGGAPDEATDRFVIRAINRYVASLEAFPHLRPRMIEAVDRIFDRLAGGEALDRQNEEMFQERMNLLHRLGDRERASGLIRSRMEDMDDREDLSRLWERLNLAYNVQDREAVQDAFDQLIATEAGRASFGPGRLDAMRNELAAWRWREEADGAALAEHLSGYFDRLIPGADETAPGPEFYFPVLEWWGSAHFPPDNPYFSGHELEGAYQALQPFLAQDAFPVVREAMETVASDSGGERLGALRFLEVCLHWWRGDIMTARLRLATAVSETDEPYLRYLAAFLFARDLRPEQTENLLAGLDGDERLEFRLAGMRFLLARDLGDEPAMARAARSMTPGIAAPGEAAAWAVLLVNEGHAPESLALLDAIDFASLDFRGRERFTQALIASSRATGDADRLVEAARSVLLKERAESIDPTPAGLRREALEVLEETDGLEEYRGYLQAIRADFPGSFRLLLLEAESHGVADSEDSRERQKALVDEAAALRHHDFDTRMDYALWLSANGYSAEAVEVVDALLRTGDPEVFFNLNATLSLYEEAGEMEQLVRWFEQWEAPEARSMDEYYGIQPTNHIMEEIGLRLRRQGQTESAIRAWQTGIRINPVRFTETMRIQLAGLSWEQESFEEYFRLLEDYLFRDRPSFEYGMWFVQPFASTVPRWLQAGRRNQDGELEAPLLEMLEPLLGEPDGADRLRRKADDWSRSHPDDWGRRVFEVIAYQLSENEGYLTKWRELEPAGIPDAVRERMADWFPALRELTPP